MIEDIIKLKMDKILGTNRPHEESSTEEASAVERYYAICTHITQEVEKYLYTHDLQLRVANEQREFIITNWEEYFRTLSTSEIERNPEIRMDICIPIAEMINLLARDNLMSTVLWLYDNAQSSNLQDPLLTKVMSLMHLVIPHPYLVEYEITCKLKQLLNNQYDCFKTPSYEEVCAKLDSKEA